MKAPFPVRFWRKIAVGAPDACWPWVLRTDSDGYGRIKRDGRFIGAHRAAYELHYGESVAGKFVCHRCDNPRCCNPGHLFLGTHQDNMADRNAKGRTASGTQNGRAKLNWQIVRAIRAAYTPRKVGASRLAARFGVNRCVVEDIVYGKTWKEAA